MGESDFKDAKKFQQNLVKVILAFFGVVMFLSIVVGCTAAFLDDVPNIKLVYRCGITAYVCLLPISWAICKLIRDNDKNEDSYNNKNPTHYKFDSTEDYQDIKHPFIICVIIFIGLPLLTLAAIMAYYMKKKLNNFT